jgi:hypothetical protein
MPASLPTFSSGLKLIRFAVFVMIAQLVLGIVLTIRLVAASSGPGVPDALAWTKWFFVANIGATLAMFVAVVRAIPELRRVHIDIRGLLIAAVGFAIAVGCLAWMYNTLATVIRLVVIPIRRSMR